ncbi:MAG: Trm112 family protein [Dehalococcoidia bacterium]|nr:Trm112 family protein [Dehalococcoidia bacterium]
MNRQLINILVCPISKGTLTLNIIDEIDGDVITGTLTSPEGRVYKIEDGIPNLLPQPQS